MTYRKPLPPKPVSSTQSAVVQADDAITLAQTNLEKLATIAKQQGREKGKRLHELHRVAQECLNTMLEKKYTDRIPGVARLLSLAVVSAEQGNSQLVEMALEELTQFYVDYLEKDAIFQGVLVPATNLSIDSKTGQSERAHDLEGFLKHDFSRAFNHVSLGPKFLTQLNNPALYPKDDFTMDQSIELKNESDNHRQLLKTKDGKLHDFEPLFDENNNPPAWAELTWESPFVLKNLQQWVLKYFQIETHAALNAFCRQVYQLSYAAVCDKNGKISEDVSNYFGHQNVNAVTHELGDVTVQTNLIAAAVQVVLAGMIAHNPNFKLFFASIGRILTIQGNALSQCAGELSELRKKLQSSDYSDKTKEKAQLIYVKLEHKLNSILKISPENFEHILVITKLIIQANAALSKNEVDALEELDRIHQILIDNSKLLTIQCEEALGKLNYLNKTNANKFQEIKEAYQELRDELLALGRFEQIAELSSSIQETIRAIENAPDENSLQKVIQDQAQSVIRLRCRHALHALETEINASDDYVNRRVKRDVLLPSQKMLARLDNPKTYKEIPALSNAVFKAAMFVKKQDVDTHNDYMKAATDAVTNSSKETRKWWAKWAGRGLMVVGGLALAAIAGISIAATFGASLGVLAAVAVTAKITASAAAAVTASSAVTMTGIALTEGGKDSQIQERFRFFGRATNPIQAFLSRTNTTTTTHFLESLANYTVRARDAYLIDQLKQERNKFLDMLFDPKAGLNDQNKIKERKVIEDRIDHLNDANASQFFQESASELKMKPEELKDKIQACYGAGSEEISEKRNALIQASLSTTKIVPIQALLLFAMIDKCNNEVFTKAQLGEQPDMLSQDVQNIHNKLNILSSMQQLAVVVCKNNRAYEKLSRREPDYNEVKRLFNSSLHQLTVEGLEILKPWIKNQFKEDREQQGAALQAMIDKELKKRAESNQVTMTPGLKRN